MKVFKNILFLLLMVFIMVSFSKCASIPKLDKSLPIDIGEVYYQHWVSGVQGGGSGFNIFIPISANSKNITLDSVFFKAKQAKLEYRNNTVFIGRFKTEANQKQDIILSNEPFAEYGNMVPEIPKHTPFELKDDECVVSYLVAGKVKYFKIDRIKRKDPKLFQGAPPKKQ